MLTVALALTLAAVPEPRPVSAFHAIENAGSWRLVVEAGDQAAVSVDAEDPADAAKIRTETKDAVLRIDCPGRCDLKKSVTVLVRVKALDSLKHSGSGEVVVTGSAKTVSLVSSGSGRLLFESAVDSANVSGSGSGAITLKGSAVTLSLSLSGAGKADAGAFPVRDANVRVSGSGSVVVNASKTLVAAVSGSGGVRYVGDPTIKQAVSGSGSIARK